ncbi:putative lipid II flippase FtsW [Collinsella tanakaei]|uniref:putative lipid II flippase FtsW n=1 Tax=Collinsella tanakaei TaxID=626935 RepID=UPI0025A4257E|nr:putative lipid II flippase FtsW [Collinsella tanakaei]MDM8299694.1 putative lipid II flippase FtsW [Collinsella tanakaei]
MSSYGAETTDRGRRVRADGRASGRRDSGGAYGAGERLIAGVPARIMKPRLVFLACLVAIVAFGLLMVYSASAVEAQSDGLAPTHYLERQALFAIAGAAIIAVLALAPGLWSWMAGRGSWILWCIAFALLVFVSAVGIAGGGARRWINLGFFTLQPSEFLKPAIILIAAKLISAYYAERTIDGNYFTTRFAAVVLLSLVLVFLQPDMGTTMIIAATLLIMLILGGISMRVVGLFILAVVLAGVAMIAFAPYRLARFTVLLDPWADPFGDGYQATLAIMAFASGGLFGRGIGNSTMKYMYLPEAHNDYILAIIGEELGFIGTLIFFAVFLLMIASAFRIAEQAPSPFARLVAQGCATILAVQFLVNALGILSVIPMTGKTMPFISYGGSSLIASMILAGLILRVSMESNPHTVYDARRQEFAVMSAEDESSSHTGRSTAGDVHVRRSSAGAQPASRREGFSVYDGAQERRRAADRPTRREDRPRRASSYDRVDLHADASERLRPRRSPRTDRSGSNRSRRDRNDR